MESRYPNIDNLKRELESLPEITSENQRKLDQKIRLEFNYNSNHIEGNTLTYGETELLLMFGKTTGDHEIREFQEMQGHDLAFEMIKDWSNVTERWLTETDIRTLNKMVLVNPFWKEAITENNQSTRRLIRVGEYKEYPNSHPFDDGNGRVSRLVMNYILLKYGYPPVIIKSADKKGYLNALNQADVGNMQEFVDYVVKEVKWSLLLHMKARKGEKLEEEKDWQKQLKIFSKKGTKAPSKRTYVSTVDLWVESIFPSVLKVEANLNTRLSTLFESSDFKVILSKGSNDKAKFDMTAHVRIQDKSKISKEKVDINSVQYLSVTFSYNNFIKNGIDTFDIELYLIFKFEQFKYSVELNTWGKTELVKAIDKNLNDADIDLITNILGQEAVRKINNYI